MNDAERRQWATDQIDLWIDNDESMYLAKQDWIARQARKQAATPTVDRFTPRLVRLAATSILGKRGTPDMKRGDWGRVDWAQVAKCWRSERPA